MARTARKRGKDETEAAEKRGWGEESQEDRHARPWTTGRHHDSSHPFADNAEIVGKRNRLRSELGSKIWKYIGKHDLHDDKDRRQVNTDDKLEKVFGKMSTSMFEMNNHLSRHLSIPKG